MSAHRILRAALVLAFGFPLAVPCLVGAQESPDWLTGRKLEEKLRLSASVGYSGVPLRQALERLSTANRVAVLIDRRADPTRELELSTTGSLRSVLLEIARAHNAVHAAAEAVPRPAAPLAVSQLGSVIYVGPVQAARYLRTLAEVRKQELREVAQLSPAARRELVRMRPWKWPDLATPRELLTQMADEVGVEVENAELIPHDLWAAADLPPLVFTDRLTLLTVQYDLAFRFAENGTRVVLAPVELKDLAIEREYNGGKNPEEYADRIRAALPDAVVQRDGAKLLVRARLEDHERLAGNLPEDGGAGKGGKQFYTMATAGASLGAVIAKIRQDVKAQGITIRVDTAAVKAAGIALDKRVAFRVDKVELDELLRTVLKPHGLEHRRTGDEIVIGPAK